MVNPEVYYYTNVACTRYAAGKLSFAVAAQTHSCKTAIKEALAKAQNGSIVKVVPGT